MNSTIKTMRSIANILSTNNHISKLSRNFELDRDKTVELDFSV